MSKKKVILVSTLLIFLVIGVICVVNKKVELNKMNIRIYKYTDNFDIQTSADRYDEIILDDEEKEELKKYYSKLIKIDQCISEAYAGRIKIECDDGSYLLYDGYSCAFYYDSKHENGIDIELGKSFRNFLDEILLNEKVQ